jgi:hypothetical protein
MSGMSSHVIWRQRYDASADVTLARALAALQCEVRELPSQQWDAATSSVGGVRDYKCSYVSLEFPGFRGDPRLTAFSGGFEIIRGDATDVAVTAPRIVKRFNVVGNINGRHSAGIVDSLLNSFLLEAREERLGNCVVPTVGSTAHAGFKPVFPTEAAPIVAAVLASLI